MPRKKVPGNSSRADTQITTVVVVGLNAEDQASLKQILGFSPCGHAPGCKWRVQSEIGVDAVLEAVRREPVAFVVFDRDYLADAWKGLIDRLAGLPHPPELIVTSRLADDRFWAEALNLGAYDVMVKPFDAAEVARIASLACTHWHRRPALRTRAMGSVA
jgi:DNA-binding NtrC family response regulator